MAELWELVERASALSAGAGPADFAAPGAAAKTPVPPPTPGADVFATPHSARPDAGGASPPPPPPSPSRTKWTRRVPYPVLIGHAVSLTLY